MPTPIAQDAQSRGREHPQRSLEAVAATMEATSTRAVAQFVALDAPRELALERLDWRVQRVRHSDVDAGVAIACRGGPLTAAERLVVRPGVSADHEVVHRALPLCLHVCRLSECVEEAIRDALRGLDVAGDHSPRPSSG